MSFLLVLSARELAVIQSCVETSLKFRKSFEDSAPELTQELEELVNSLSAKPARLLNVSIHEGKGVGDA